VSDDLVYTMAHYSRYEEIHYHGVYEVFKKMWKAIPTIVLDMKRLRGIPTGIPDHPVRNILEGPPTTPSRLLTERSENDIAWDQMRENEDRMREEEERQRQASEINEWNIGFMRY
jgi:hypothetical protein